MSAKGSCFCGAVRFSIAKIRGVAHCHCTMCRRAHGAAFVTWVTVKRPDFHLDAGEESLTTFRSSGSALRRFCGSCGTMLFFEGERWADEVHVARALVEGEVPEPMAHVFWDDRVSWIEMGDHLPRKGGVTGTEPQA